jgi:ribosomal subunit interface protein
MKTNIKFTDTERDETLKVYALEKVEAFTKLMTDQAAKDAVCDIELRHSTHHQNGDVCYAEVNLEANGKLFRVSKEEQNFKKAIDKVKDDILAQLRKNKEKHHDSKIRGAGKVKEMLTQH